MTELTARQRFELAMRCIEIEDAAVAGDGLVESFADLVGRDRTQFVVLPPAPPTPPDPTAADRTWLAEQERAYATGQA